MKKNGGKSAKKYYKNLQKNRTSEEKKNSRKMTKMEKNSKEIGEKG